MNAMIGTSDQSHWMAKALLLLLVDIDHMCCSALGMVWAQQAPVQALSFRLCRFYEPSGTFPIRQHP